MSNYLEDMFIDDVKGCLMGGCSGESDDGPELLDTIVGRSVTELTCDSEIVGVYAFYRWGSLTTAYFPKATSIGEYAFEYCENLTTVNFPKATSIGEYAFG